MSGRPIARICACGSCSRLRRSWSPRPSRSPCRSPTRRSSTSSPARRARARSPGSRRFGFAAVPAMLIVAYGVGRVLMVLFAQFRDVWFTVVAQHAVRELANRTFRHLHALSLRFHLERRTGGLSRVIERGVNGVDTIVRMAVLELDPDRGRARDDRGPGRLVFRLDLRGGRARSPSASMSGSPSGPASGASPSAAT